MCIRDSFYADTQFRDDLSWTKGKHQTKFGFSYMRVVKNQELQANTEGTAVFNSSSFSGDSYVNFLLGDESSFTQLQFLANKHWVNNNYSFYANDNWHVTGRLTLNIGLRYDALPHAFETVSYTHLAFPSASGACQLERARRIGSWDTDFTLGYQRRKQTLEHRSSLLRGSLTTGEHLAC